MTSLFDGRVLTVSLLACATLIYAVALGGLHSFWIWGRPDRFDLTFNSMLEHLLRGEFDVDPDVIGMEGFSRGGRVYAYWGIFCAVLRVPLALIPGGLRLDVTSMSCWIAVCTAATIKLRTLRLVYHASPPSSLRETLYWTLALSLLFGGAQIQFLKPSIYQEVCFWAGVLAAVFVYLAVRGIASNEFGRSTLSWLAAVAGLALLTRASTGVGLYAAAGLLLATEMYREVSTSRIPAKTERRYAWATLPSKILWPIVILGIFAALSGLINYNRWGDPFTFMNINIYNFNREYHDRLTRGDTYGVFNFARIPFGLVYYFFPIWVLYQPDGSLFFAETQRRLIDAAELPPGSLLLTDPLMLLLTASMAWSMFRGQRRPVIDPIRTMAVSAGLVIPCVLMLAAIYMTFRYRMDFYPFMEFGAFVGFLALCRSALTDAATARMRGVSIALAALGIAASMVSLALYWWSDFGPSNEYLRAGLFNYYSPSFEDCFQSLTRCLTR